MLQSEFLMEKGPHPVPGLGAKREVLVIDDNKVVRDALSKMLVSLGCKVTLAGNGFQGGILFLTRSYDLAIIDLDVPQMNVWELARIMKEHSPKTPVIVANGDHKGDSLLKLDRDKVDAIILKPFRLKDFEGTVQKLLNSET
jgi:two-component system, NarL family, capsular synthesis sensor histidine kinase RcsC